jgi:predicted ribosome quality control (RQC) complex YloA/Tae2 family protein
MENFYLNAVVKEARPEIEGRAVSRVEVTASDLVIDLKLSGDRVLVASLDGKSPALFLARKRSLPAKGQSASPFVLQMKKYFVSAKIIRFSKAPMSRVLRIVFENYDVAGKKEEGSLWLALTGRTSNAFLMNSEGDLRGSLFDSGRSPAVFDWPPDSDIDTERLIESIADTATREEILQTQFGNASVFAPVWREEFIARSFHESPAEAFRSLVKDLCESEPSPILYSSFPLDQFGRRLTDLKRDLILSPIELRRCEGMLRAQFQTFSEAAEEYYDARRRDERLRSAYNGAQQMIAARVKKLESTTRAIEADLERLEDPDKLKKLGDLLLAGAATAKVEGSAARVIDYYDPDQPEIEIDLGDSKTPQQAATRYFARYQKSRRALTAVAERREAMARELGKLKELLARLEGEPTAAVIESVRQMAESILGIKPSARQPKGKRIQAKKDRPAGRRFRSTDGYEIVVGRNDRDNDLITFRVARSLDIWLHAADYPGSHVLIRNPNRDEVPHRTLNEAAQVAAFYSQAKREGKAAVHYTQKKFISKPPKAKPGLVRLSSFRTLLVEPRCDLQRIDD